MKAEPGKSYKHHDINIAVINLNKLCDKKEPIILICNLISQGIIIF